MQIGIIPYAGVDIATFELMKQHLLEEYHGDPHPVSILAAGMLSSSVAQFASYPLSLVRTRLQVGPAAAPDRLLCHIGAAVLQAALTGPGTRLQVGPAAAPDRLLCHIGAAVLQAALTGPGTRLQVGHAVAPDRPLCQLGRLQSCKLLSQGQAQGSKWVTLLHRIDRSASLGACSPASCSHRARHSGC